MTCAGKETVKLMLMDRSVLRMNLFSNMQQATGIFIQGYESRPLRGTNKQLTFSEYKLVVCMCDCVYYVNVGWVPKTKINARQTFIIPFTIH